ncbi:MAG: hypothetical protein IJX72_06745, partial [Clostridia bacterium]|nr:hypothetical protein [Clostridia bacterium]
LPLSSPLSWTLLSKKEQKENAKGGLFEKVPLWSLACGLGHAAALTPHRGVIHYRVAASLPLKNFQIGNNQIVFPF